jgi:HD-GYP domain-containing protein (c-di-GMP phosphodiesterase class II)
MQEDEPWSSVLELEPSPVRYVDEADLDEFCFTLADFVDLKPATASAHSRRTAEIAEQIATRLRLSAVDATLVRRAALVHDIGMVSVPSFLMEKGRRWSESDFERYRLHPYYTERILAMSDALRPAGEVAASHHERLDGSGYHRRLAGRQLSVPARIVAAASNFVEASEADAEARPEQVVARLKQENGFDLDCLDALSAEMAGLPARPGRRQEWPSGLTEREVEVLRLIASGLNLKQAANKLVISDHTARHHLESIYGKAGVSSRAGMTLFAVENGLLNS